MTMVFRLVICAALVLGSLSLAADAQADEMVFKLSSHDDGSENPPAYGLRLDGLDGDTSTEWTFDFSHADSAMYLTYDDVAGTIRIHGKAYGGEDIGGSYAADASTGVYTIDFTYAENVEVDEDNGFNGTGDDKLRVSGSHADNKGTITGPAGAGSIEYDLTDYMGKHSYSFKFNNTDDHRLSGSGLSGPTTYVGWGWVNHSGATGHVYSSDWLFTAQPVPEPSTLALMGLSGLGVVLVQRRRKGAREA